MNISLVANIANIFWCTVGCQRTNCPVCHTLFRASNVVTHYTLHQQWKKVGMFDIDCLLGKRKWKTQQLLDAEWLKERDCLEDEGVVEVIILK